MKPRRPALRSWLLAAALVLLIAGHLILGTSRTSNSVYSSGVGVYGEYMNGFIRLVFPFLVTLVGAVMLQDRVTNGFVSLTRARISVSAYVWKLIGAGIARNAIFFGVLGIFTTVFAAFVATARQPGLVDPRPYNLSAGGVIAQQAQQNPIGGFIAGGPLVYGLLATLWMVVGAAVLSLAASASVLVIRRRALALVAPLIAYLAESILVQVLGQPAWGFLLILPVPSNLQRFPVYAAAAPVVLVALASFLLVSYVLRQARTSGRLS